MSAFGKGLLAFGHRVWRAAEWRIARCVRGAKQLGQNAAFRGRNAAFRARNFLLLNRPLQMTVAGIPLRLAPRGAIATALWHAPGFEERELRVILEFLRPGMTFLDAGANAGLWSLAAAKKMGVGHLFAFEPCASTFGLLQENIRHNGLGELIVPVRTALGDRTGQATLKLNAPGKDGLNTLGRPTHSECEVVSQETVPVTTLDAFMESQGITRVDVLKVDVEGAELPLFHGAAKLLGRPDGPLILYEGYSWCTAGFNYHPVEILWLLADFGYEFFGVAGANGRAVPRRPAHGYDAMIIAAKPGHASFGKLTEGAT